MLKVTHGLISFGNRMEEAWVIASHAFRYHVMIQWLHMLYSGTIQA